MKLQIRWKDCDRSKAVEASIEQKLAILDKYDFLNENIKVEIVHYAKTNIFKTRINVDVKGGNVLRTEASADKIYTSVNLALDKMQDQLRRIKTKYNEKKNSKKNKGLKTRF